VGEAIPVEVINKVATLLVRLGMVLNPALAEEQPSLVTLSKVGNNLVSSDDRSLNKRLQGTRKVLIPKGATSKGATSREATNKEEEALAINAFPSSREWLFLR
jgi:hypothetical protein